MGFKKTGEATATGKPFQPSQKVEDGKSRNDSLVTGTPETPKPEKPVASKR